MSFIQLSDIPFKKLLHSYVADLGDIRLVVNDEALLVKDAYSHINPISGVQQNFEYYLKLPLKSKLNDIGSPVFMTLANLDELRDFLFKGKTYIRDCLAAGWVVKNAVINMTLDELKVWKDSRIEE